VNHVILVGKLLNVWHFNTTANGIPVASNVLITLDKDRLNEIRSESHEIVVWGPRAREIVADTKAGDIISVIGKIMTSDYTTKAGERRTTKKIRVQKFGFVQL